MKLTTSSGKSLVVLIFASYVLLGHWRKNNKNVDLVSDFTPDFAPGLFPHPRMPVTETTAHNYSLLHVSLCWSSPLHQEATHIWSICVIPAPLPLSVYITGQTQWSLTCLPEVYTVFFIHPSFSLDWIFLNKVNYDSDSLLGWHDASRGYLIYHDSVSTPNSLVNPHPSIRRTHF